MIVRIIPLTAVLGIAINGSVSAQTVSTQLPPNPELGECYARVFVPESRGTYTETVDVGPEKVTFRTIPAKYQEVRYQSSRPPRSSRPSRRRE